MNRDRKIIVVLVVCLAASLVLNWRLWSRSRMPTTAAVSAAVEPKGKPNADRDAGKTPASFDIVANPELKGRLGRIVLNFSGEVTLDGHSTRTAIYAAGRPDSLKTAYNAFAAELPSGKYDLEVSGKKLTGIVVEPAKDTRIRSGVLRTHGAADTRMAVFDVGGTETLRTLYGNNLLGLPVGDYEIEVSGVREKVTITADKVTDF